MIVGRGGGVVMLYVVSFFLFGLRPLFLFLFVYLTSCANYRMNFSGVF